MKKALKLFLCLALVFMISACGKGGSSNGTTVGINKSLKIKSEYVDLDVRATSVEKNASRSYLLGDSYNFTRIGFKALNNSSKTSNRMYLSFSLVDDNKNEVGSIGCVDSLWASTYDGMNDAINFEIQPNSTETGYLYCEDPNNTGKFLRIISYTSFDLEAAKQGTIKSTASEEFYIKLN